MNRRKQGGFGAFGCPNIDDAPAAQPDKIVGCGEKGFEGDLAYSRDLALAAKPLERERECTLIGKQPGARDVDTAALSAQHHDTCRGAGASEQSAGNIAGQDFFGNRPFVHLTYLPECPS